MNHSNASKILNFKEGTLLDKKTIKQQYLKCALKSHPDKNKGKDTSEEFQKVKEAYDYLNKHIDTQFEKEKDWFETIYLFFDKILETPFFSHLNKEQKLHISTFSKNLCEKNKTMIAEKTIIVLQKMQKYITILKTQPQPFKQQPFSHFTNNTKTSKIKKNIIVVTLNPSLKNVLNDQIFKFTQDDKHYLIPLWCKSVKYVMSPNIEIIVKCVPKLKQNIVSVLTNQLNIKNNSFVDDFTIINHFGVDKNNNLHICVKYEINHIWNKMFLVIFLENRKYIICTSTLFFKEKQTVIFKKSGISCCDENNLFDTSNKADVLIHVTLFNRGVESKN